jgi:hypothetical protein
MLSFDAREQQLKPSVSSKKRGRGLRRRRERYSLAVPNLNEFAIPRLRVEFLAMQKSYHLSDILIMIMITH